nr:MAG TPA: hypothetical protein [Caudoviricetes sp.]
MSVIITQLTNSLLTSSRTLSKLRNLSSVESHRYAMVFLAAIK